MAALVTCGGESNSPPPPPIDSAPLDAQLVETCTRLVSCDAATFASVGRCLVANVGPLRPIYADRLIANVNGLGGTRYASIACIAATGGDCNAVNACSHGRVDTCEGSGDTCEGSRVVNCTNGKRTELDCSLRNCTSDYACDHDEPPGSQCLTLDAGVAACGFGTCVKSMFPSHCDGNALVTCVNGVVNRQDCDHLSSVGRGCVPTDIGATCDSILPPCGDEQHEHCEGADVVSCYDHRTHRDACSRYPLPLVCSDGKCVPSPQLHCNPETQADTCRGTTLVYCDGQERTIDCQTLGFTSCEATAKGAVCR